MPALEEAKKLIAEFSVPVVVEVILERVTNISMGTELDNVTEFEELALSDADAPTAIALLDDRCPASGSRRGAPESSRVAPRRDVARAVAAGCGPERDDLDVVCVIADGGDGTLDAAVAAGYERIEVEAPGPTGHPVKAGYARQAEVGVFELAEVVGLNRLPGGTPAPLDASTVGLGTLIRHALDRGCRHLVLALGGSASTDGGAGMVQALGGRVLGTGGDDLPPGGGALTELAGVDLEGLHPGLADSRVVVASDVENPLLGPSGAAAVYGPQKGASAEDIALLERGLQRWADAVARATGADFSSAAGAGAAGGTGFAPGGAARRAPAGHRPRARPRALRRGGRGCRAGRDR